MKVCIAEKPSVGREIAMIIGATNRKDGYYEGNGYAVTWTFGHFCTLKEPNDYNPAWKKWNFNTLPLIPEKFETKLIKNKGVKKQFAVIKTLLKSASLVINCGDAGQEGELIQRWVINQAKYKGPTERLWISSLTAEAIKDGFQNLRPASDFDNLYYAGSSRAIGDWLLGLNATRMYTLKYGGFKQLLSIGRVQTPTLAMLVERYKEIENFVPSPYWELQTLYRNVTFNCEKGKFQKKEEAEKILEQVTGHDFTILSFTKKEGKEYAPRLFDLTSLQVHCNKRFGYTADQTLKLVQKLYEQKVVTYPRVDTTFLPNDVYPKVPGILKRMTNYSQLTQPLLAETIRKSSKVFNDKKVTDHHAIIPTGYEKSLPTNEQNVYNAIARRFIAAFYPDCVVNKTTVIGEANKIKFKATGKEILEEGWRVVFKVAKSTTQDEDRAKALNDENILPVFKKGESGPHVPTLLEKMTKAPNHYTEATLLRAMETAGKQVDDHDLRDLMKANGIGRPSTRANIIETLFRRHYAMRKKKSIIATETGIQLIDIIQNNLLKSPELTGQWEKQLREIESGEHSAKQFITDMKNMVSGLVDEVRSAVVTKRITSSQNTVAPKKFKSKTKVAKPKAFGKHKVQAKKLDEANCPKCNKGKLLKGKTAYGCSQWQAGCKFRLPFSFMDKKISENQLLRLVNKGSTVKLKGFKKEGQKVNGLLTFDDQHQIVFEGSTATKTAAKPSAKKDSMLCPQCGKGQVIKGKTAYGCSQWQAGCKFRFPFETIREKANGKTLTKVLVSKILRDNI